MKRLIIAVVMMGMMTGWAGDALRVVRNELDWSADVIVVTNRFPQAEESVVSNFFAKGGALVVLAGQGKVGDPPKGMPRWPDDLGSVMMYPNEIAPGAKAASVYRAQRGLALVVSSAYDGKPLMENVAWHLGMMRRGYGFYGNSCKFHPELGRPIVTAKFRYELPIADKDARHDFILNVETTSEDGCSRNYRRDDGDIRRSFRWWGLQAGATSYDPLYHHGKTHVVGVMTDLTTGEEFKVYDRVFMRPPYLELLMPTNGVVSVDRAEPYVRFGVRINDEYHYQEDTVKVSAFGPDDKEIWSAEVKIPATEVTTWLAVPFERADTPVGRVRIVAETLRDIDKPVRQEATFSIVPRQKFIRDQDGMAIVDGVRQMSFPADDAAAKDYRSAASFVFGERCAMTSAFAHALLTARNQDPSAALLGEITVGKGTGDAADDLRTLKALAHLAVVTGANAIRWKDNTAELATKGIEREIAALGPEALRPSQTIVSTDGFVYARLFGNRLLCVNTERFAAHESELRSMRLPGGSLRLTLEPNEVRVVEP